MVTTQSRQLLPQLVPMAGASSLLKAAAELLLGSLTRLLLVIRRLQGPDPMGPAKMAPLVPPVSFKVQLVSGLGNTQDSFTNKRKIFPSHLLKSSASARVWILLSWDYTLCHFHMQECK